MKKLPGASLLRGIIDYGLYLALFIRYDVIDPNPLLHHHGADDALDTLKELAEALGNDPNFATTITNKLTDLRNALTDEVNRAKEEEGKLSTQISEVNSNFIKAVDLLNDKIDTAVTNLINKIDKIEAKVDKNTADTVSYTHLTLPTT